MSVSIFIWSTLLLCFGYQASLAYHYFWKKDRELVWGKSAITNLRSVLTVMWPTFVWMFGIVPLKNAVSIDVPAEMVFLRDEEVVAVFEHPTSFWYWDEGVQELVGTDMHRYSERTITVEIPPENSQADFEHRVRLTVVTNATLEDFLRYHRIFGHQSPEEIVGSIMRVALSQCIFSSTMSASAVERAIRMHMGVAFEAALSDTGMELISIEVFPRRATVIDKNPENRPVWASISFLNSALRAWMSPARFF